MATAKAQGWHQRLLQRGLLQDSDQRLFWRRECGPLQVWASGPGVWLLAALVDAVLTRCMRPQEVVVKSWSLVAEFLVVFELEWLLSIFEKTQPGGATSIPGRC